LTGRLIAVVGPSGVGKDSVIAAIAAARPDLHRVRRVITRQAPAGGEPFESVEAAAFARLVGSGAFALHWQAHGLGYGVPVTVDAVLASGGDAIANLSRTVLEKAARRFDRLHVVALSASPDRLAARLAARGRETPEDIARRLARPAPPLPAGVPVLQLANDGPLPATVAAALAVLYPESTPTSGARRI